MNTSADLRARAAGIVLQVLEHGRSLEVLLQEMPSNPRERGLLRSLSFDSVRWYVRLDALLRRLSSAPVSRLEPEVRALAIVGLCELQYSETPAHAVVAETVNATRVIGKPRAAGLINALLRRCQREGAEILRDLDRDPAIATAHPEWLVEALRQDWPQHWRTLLEANNARPPMWLRINRQRTTVADYQRQLATAGIESSTFAGAPEALLLAKPMDVQQLPEFKAGFVSVQDAAAQHAAHLLGARDGDRVLDLCAAPGGKTCHVLELHPTLSELVAVDNSNSRMKRVRENLDRLALQATLVTANAARPELWWDGRPFQRILLDVPCSATGVIRRHPDIKLLRRPSDIGQLARTQAGLLKSAWSMLAAGGRLVYASCSALTTENGAVVRAFLDEHRDAVEARIEIAAGPGTENAGFPGTRILVGDAGRDGFYYACLDKSNTLQG